MSLQYHCACCSLFSESHSIKKQNFFKTFKNFALPKSHPKTSDFLLPIPVSLLLAIATEIRVLAVWVPSLHKKIGGSTKLAWFTVVKVLLMTSFICAPLIAIHEVTMGVCVPVNVEVLTTDEEC